MVEVKRNSSSPMRIFRRWHRKDWTPDGQGLLVTYTGSSTEGFDIGLIDMQSRKLTTLVSTPDDEDCVATSPSGQWIAYESNRSGTYEVFIEPLSGPRRPRQVSLGGGRNPAWAPDGGELYYLTEGDGTLSAVPLTGTALELGTPRRIGSGGYLVGACTKPAVAPDGRLMLQRRGDAGGGVVAVVLNWLAELAEQVSTP